MNKKPSLEREDFPLRLSYKFLLIYILGCALCGFPAVDASRFCGEPYRILGWTKGPWPLSYVVKGSSHYSFECDTEGHSLRVERAEYKMSSDPYRYRDLTQKKRHSVLPFTKQYTVAEADGPRQLKRGCTHMNSQHHSPAVPPHSIPTPSRAQHRSGADRSPGVICTRFC